MSIRELYEYLLIELNKVNAPSMLLSDFNYFVNSAIYKYMNKRYTVYDTLLLTTDDLLVLKSTAIYNNENIVSKYEETKNPSLKNTKQIILPEDYFHILNCWLTLSITPKFSVCKNSNPKITSAKATKLTADMWNSVIDNYWNKPSYLKPYYYIHTINPEIDYLKDSDKINGNRYGNSEKIECEIRFGEDENVTLEEVIIDYIRTPRLVRLTQEQLDSLEDTSQILEFPDYVCQEIIRELVNITLENTSDQRLLTYPVVSKSIEAQQLTQ